MDVKFLPCAVLSTYLLVILLHNKLPQNITAENNRYSLSCARRNTGTGSLAGSLTQGVVQDAIISKVNWVQILSFRWLE